MSDNLDVPSKRRKPHRKSRNGCLDCRRRRVKCGEERPSCAACVRRKARCQYPEEKSEHSHLTVPSDGQHPSSPAGSASTLSDPLVAQNPQSQRSASVLTESTRPPCSIVNGTTQAFDLSDLRLLHHWTVYTSTEFFRGSDLHHMWQTLFPQVGFQYPYVLHALLSLAALHLAYRNPQERSSLVLQAVNHHSKALQGFQTAIACITEKNSEALFMWSICNVLYVFAMSNPVQNSISTTFHSEQKDKLLGTEWIPMIKGMEAVLRPIQNYLQTGRMKGLLSVGNWFELDPDQDSMNAADGSFCGTRKTWEGSPESETYEEVLQTIRKCHSYAQQFRFMDAQAIEQWDLNRAWSAPLMFVLFAPEPYFILLQQRQPPALVLFSFFGALLHEFNDCWFFEGWGKAIVGAVEDILGSCWRPWISWPLQVVN